jgi:hypothetical protein
MQSPTHALRVLVTTAMLCGIGMFVATNSHAQNLREKFIGCYRIEIGPWTPALGPSAQFHTPPSSFRLTGDSLASNRRGTSYAVTPAIRHEYSRGRGNASWSPADSAGFRVLWSDGFTGAELRLFERGFNIGTNPEYFGVIQALSDAIGPIESVPKASVTGWKVPCD